MEYKVIFGVPCHNSANWVDWLLHTFTIQTDKDFECWFALDDCTDNTEDIILSYRDRLDIRIFKCNYHTPSSTRQLILDNAPSGSYIFWCDSDDCVLNNAVSIIKEAIEPLKKRGDILAMYEREHVDFISLEKNDTETARGNEMILSYVCGNLYSVDMLRKADIRFDDNLVYDEDTDFNMKILEYEINKNDDYTILMSPSIIYFYRVNTNSMSFDTEAVEKANINRWVSDIFTHTKGKQKYSVYYQLYTNKLISDSINLIGKYNRLNLPKKKLFEEITKRLKANRFCKDELLQFANAPTADMKTIKVRQELIGLINRMHKR